MRDGLREPLLDYPCHDGERATLIADTHAAKVSKLSVPIRMCPRYSCDLVWEERLCFAARYVIQGMSDISLPYLCRRCRGLVLHCRLGSRYNEAGASI